MQVINDFFFYSLNKFNMTADSSWQFFKKKKMRGSYYNFKLEAQKEDEYQAQHYPRNCASTAIFHMSLTPDGTGVQVVYNRHNDLRRYIRYTYWFQQEGVSMARLEYFLEETQSLGKGLRLARNYDVFLNTYNIFPL